MKNHFTKIFTVVLFFLIVEISASTFAPNLIVQEQSQDCGDTVTFKNGTTVKAKILETNENEIKYKRCANINGPTISIPKGNISNIKYLNGTLESFKDFKPKTQLSDTAKFAHRYVGIGIRATGLQTTDLLTRQVPPFRLVFNVDPVENFRIEGQYGIYRKNTEVNVSTGTSTVSFNEITKSSYIGFGIMGMYQKNKTRFITGIRYAINKYSDDDIYYVTYTFPTIATNNGKMTLISGMIGGEYFFAKFVSLGAEFGISTLKDVYEPAAVFNQKSITNKTLMTEGSLIFRFYPF